ncbi:calmodulin-binding transcription activator 4-like isoform X2 [Durio zibethinus]|uniref:Calmodulin-binding transcription activator 4-like isoform X2 n=1 Tax=Durio zibethinus TaxID=66656 RepID=A0A6P6BGX5_DURZI|nr:calmodulin-binding transcription activator 4-like isoform X2 [Durio zibethinus]
MEQSGYDINNLFREAQARWLKPAEVLFILQNHEKYQLTQEPPQKPTSGSLFLFNKRVLRFFRKDGHSWRKKKDGRTVGEAHERLKAKHSLASIVQSPVSSSAFSPSPNSYNSQNPGSNSLACDVHQTYQNLSSPGSVEVSSDIVIKHNEIDNSVEYTIPADLQVSQALKRIEEQLSLNEDSFKDSSASIVQSPVSSSAFSPSPNSYTSQNRGSNSLASDVHETFQNLSSPGSVEVSSDIFMKNNGIDNTVEYICPADLQVSHALKRLEEQLSLNEDSFKEMSPFCSLDGDTDDSKFLEYGRETAKQDPQEDLLYEPDDIIQDHLYSQPARVENYSNNFALLSDGGKNGEHSQVYSNDNSDGSKESLYWKNVLDSCKNQSGVDSQGRPLSSSRTGPTEQQEQSVWLNFNGSDLKDSSVLLCQEAENVEIPSYSSAIQAIGTNSDYYTMLCNQDNIEIPLATDSSLTVAQKQKFTIWEISPEWGYSSEATKVIIVGSFLCDPSESESAWACMFGETEVPLEIIQEGVVCCKAPPHLPGKVTLCITDGNRESCSEIREFEYRVNASSCARCNLSHTEVPKSLEELLLLVRFVQMLLSDSSLQKDSIESHLLRKSKADDDSWSHVIEALLIGSGTSSGIVDWLLQELLKDKLQLWLCSRSKETGDRSVCTMSKKDQGIIHMAAGLGFEWALNPILNHGVSINFRDINGWTALHWAARFGREKMVAALIASGASAGAVTDPTSQDLSGKTAASIAASSGHKGLAGYLSEVALTSHLSSLTLEESELSKGSAAVQAEMAVNSISKGSLATSEDQLSLKDTLAAVRNATQAAARIQNAFRAHSFRKRQQKEVAATAASVDEYGISSDEIKGLSTMSKLAFGNARHYNLAALSIQKKFRGWKGRKDFLSLRQKVIKIQAHVRGYQIRKNYKVICWAVGVLDKVVLRWRRKGVGLRGFRSEPEPIDESEDEDILKVFRKQKVDVAVNEALSRVLSMVDSPDARQQYRRLLERYRQAKAELGNTNEPAASTSLSDIDDMESDDFFQFP